MTHANEIAEFLRYLHSSLDPEEEIYLAPADNPEACVAVGDIDTAIRLAAEWRERGVYASSGVFLAGTARKREHLLSIPAVVLDQDLKDKLIAEGVEPKEADRKIRACSPEVLEKMCEKHRQWIKDALSTLGLEPSAIIFTGGGHQTSLLIDFLDTQEVDRIVNVQKAFVAKLNDLVGWDLCDTSAQDAGTRYIRVAGTANVKSDPPRWAAIVQNGGPTYTLAQLEAAIGQQSQEQASKEEGETEEASAEVVRILLSYWKKGKRHELALSLCGYLAKADWQWSKVKACLVAIARQAEDEELSRRLNDLKTTFARLAKGEEVRGYTALAKILTAEDMRHLEEATGSGEIPIDETPVERWPELHEDALYGIAGEIVRAIDPYTEAHQVATLVNFLVGFGNCINATAHAIVQHDRHPGNLFAVFVGASSKGRKGLGWSTPRHLFAQVDPDWSKARIKTGLSSGEGLIYNVRDEVWKEEPVKEKGRVVDYQLVKVDSGESDKRLFLIEPEFASTLTVMTREGNTLSAVIRQAWDTGALSPLTRNSPIKATGAHISIVGHITKDELLARLDDTSKANGFANRFWWFLIRRSKELPDGEPIPDDLLTSFVERLTTLITYARSTLQVKRDPEARSLWHQIYHKLSGEKPGLLGAVLARAEAQVLRVSMLYALLDKSDVIGVEHLKAALALWKYAEESALLIFGQRLGDPTADRILEALRNAGPSGLSDTDIYELFGRNKSANERARALNLLVRLGLVTNVRRPPAEGGKRHRKVWVATCT
jgi:hypothetical protein